MIKYRLFTLSIILITTLFLSSCSIKSRGDEKLKDLPFEVIEYHYLNTYIRDIYNKNKLENNRISYKYDNALYLIVCYGAMPTDGYSIEVKELYETENSIIVDTTLVGPSKSETVNDKTSYPATVIKIAYTDKIVIFR